jgi:hypothetical protein
MKKKTKKPHKFRCNKVSVLIILGLVLQPPVLKTSQCLWSSSFIFSSKGKKAKKNPPKTKTKTIKQNPKFKCNTVSVSPSASYVVVSSKEEKKKRGSLETALWMSIWGCGSSASYCQPCAAAGFVYLEFSWTHVPFVFSSIQPYLLFAIALFLALRVALPPLQWSFPRDSCRYKPSPLQAQWGR